MSKEEIRFELDQVLNEFSDDALQELLSYLKSIQNTHAMTLLTGDNLKKILSEDKELLQKLAK